MDESESQIIAGQLWSLKRCRRRAVVQMVERIGNQDVIHISILDGDGDVIVGHAPFDRAAFLSSVDRVMSHSGADADFHEGYAYWRTEFERGAAGVFSIDVCELA